MVRRIPFSFAFGATGTVLSASLKGVQGRVENAYLECPNFTNDVTTTITIEDVSSKEIYNSTAKARNANYRLAPAVLVADMDGAANTIKATLSGDAGGSGGTVVLVLYVWL